MAIPGNKRVIGLIIIPIIILLGCLLVALRSRSPQRQSFFRPAPPELTLRALGNATNYLRFDHQHDWKAFCISNGTSKRILYAATELEYRTAGGWRSAGDWLSGTLGNTSLMTHRDTAGEIPPGSNDVFYASVRSTNLSWRLHVGCFVSSWQDSSLVRSIASSIYAPPASKSWSGARYEIIGDEIKP